MNIITGLINTVTFTRHAGLDPASRFLMAVQEGSWTPDQVRGDDVGASLLGAIGVLS